MVRSVVLAVSGAVFLSVPTSALTQSWIDDTHLVDVHDETSLSNRVRQVSHGGYELSDGTPVSFRNWYSSNWSDVHVTWMTEVTRNFGIYWGFSTGEFGEKYHIRPGLRLGFLAQTRPSQNSTVSLSVIGILGGNIKEDTCTANYGAIGGTQTVNCRLAASTLPPAQTLNHMLDDAPSERLQAILQYQLKF